MRILIRAVQNSVVTFNKNYVRPMTVCSTIDNANKNSEILKSWKEIPGPSSLPFIGPIHHFLPGGDLHDLGPKMGGIIYKKYGPLIRLDSMFGSKPLIFVIDSEISSHILRSENWLPLRPGFEILEYYRKHVVGKSNPIESTGLLTEQGETWKKFRSTVNPIMLHSKIIKLYGDTLEEVAEDMTIRLRSKRNRSNGLDCKFDEELNLWSLESIGIIALGCRLYCFDPNLPEDAPSKRLIKIVHDLMDCFIALDFRPSLWRYMATPKYNKTIKLLQEQTELNTHFIRKAISHVNKETEMDNEKSVLEKLIEIDENVALTMASDMLFAGIDTVANSILGTLYLLAKNQDKQNKLREEVKSNNEKRPYTKACIKEAMRIMPVVSGNLRQATKDYNVMGYKIPKGLNVTFGHQYLSIIEENYPRPSEFIPERWLAEKNDPIYHGNAHPFAYSPFGFGVRSCIGRRIAELEMEIFLAKLINNFVVEWDGAPPKIKSSTLNYVVGPYNFKFKDV